ncbi:hypothetical protein Patl1_23234 [Pistacia atlantica]|uniref:Uncharacterized protein n=1 Tax=Pistacia atlantica TaxID=434234 RepID=A0ACC1A2B3_9ROSI|nr:hypothetical protein Patl1_23234 [Pistacia atlantica]
MGQCSSQQRWLQPGDQITTNRIVFVYHHHGIYVGDGMVIHLLPLAKQSNSSTPCQNCGHTPSLHGGIVKTCLDCFLDGNSLYILDINSMYCKPPDEVVKIVTEFFQGIRTFGDYNFAFNNCEDFASFCKTGKKSSEQRWNATVLSVLPSAMLSGGRVIVGPAGGGDGVSVSCWFRF